MPQYISTFDQHADMGMFDDEHRSHAVSITLPSEMNVASLLKFFEELIDGFSTKKSLRIDVSAATIFEAPIPLLAIQLLTAARQHAATIGVHFSLVGFLPPVLVSALVRGGFMTGTSDDIAFWNGDIR